MPAARSSVNLYSSIHPYSTCSVPSLTHPAARTLRRKKPARNETSTPTNIKPKAPKPNSSNMSSSSRTLSSGELVFYLRDSAMTDRIVEEFRAKLSGPLGFDIEYKPNFIKGNPMNKTALVQLASPDVILLVQVSAMPEFPHTIKDILEDPLIVKAGVGIQGDAKKISNDFGFTPASCLELSLLAKIIDPQWKDSNNLISLARLVKSYEGYDMPKSKHIRMGDWERLLSEKQQDYAANDARAGLSVLRKLYTILDTFRPYPATSLYLF